MSAARGDLRPASAPRDGAAVGLGSRAASQRSAQRAGRRTANESGEDVTGFESLEGYSLSAGQSLVGGLRPYRDAEHMAFVEAVARRAMAIATTSMESDRRSMETEGPL